MAKHKVFVSEPAENDLREIIKYISAQLSAPLTAVKMLEAIEGAINELSDVADLCRLVADERLAAMGYRKKDIKSYIIFFTVNENAREVDVERILYARRDWLRNL